MKSQKWLALMVAGSICVFGACGDLTEVTNTGIVQPESEHSAAGAAAWHVGGTQRFVGAALMAIRYGAVFSDEWIDANLIGNGVEPWYDARRALPADREVTPPYPSVFTTLSQALVTLRFAAASLQQFAPNPGSRVGQMLAYQGYLELYLAEQLCNGIPFSTVDVDGNVTYGGATTTAETYARAIAHFDSAIAVSTDSARVLNLARVAKGRALLGLGQFAQAAAAVASVPTSFVYNLDINAGVAAQQNSLYAYNSVMRWQGVPSTTSGANGINWVAANDPRVRTTRVGLGPDNVTVIYQYLGHISLGSPVALASGIEARLIEAEAALRANNDDASPTGTGWLGILNGLRASAITPAMPALADPGSYPARVDLLFRERAFWLFLTANRMPDMRRLVRQYGRAQDAVFPSGMHKDGLPFGNEVTLTPPFASEVPNTSYTGCIDRNA
jgi:starch-binding outer membrane protein, SusD/RagB family